ncbi:MAG: hypothetical protein KDB30_04810 [Tetrasphaera sp.]|nr:hypothetical protein [Tetrasphaera sp.]
MTLYNQFATDREKETDGVEVSYAPNEDGTVPTFVVARTSKTNKQYTKALEKAIRPYKRQIDLGTMDNDVAEEIFRTVFAKTILKGWSGIQDKDGNEFPYTTANAIKLLTDLPDLYEDLQERAKSAAAFKQESLEDDAKN